MKGALREEVAVKASVQHRYGPPDEVCALEDVTTPAPGRGEVLVRVRAAGANWADWSMAMGRPYLMRLGYGLRRPRRGIRGTDVAGVVEAVGVGVTGLRPGDEVLGWGTATFAEYAAVPEYQLVAKPVALSFEQAAGVAMAGCVALQAMRDVGGVRPGDRVLVNGASGGIGSFAVQIAKAFGAEVTAVCSTPNLALVRALGADRVLDYTTTDFTEEAVHYDLILDIADRHTLAARRHVLASGGTLIPNSGEGGPWVGSIGRIIRAWVTSPFVSQKLRPFLSVAKRDDLLALCEMVEAGLLSPVVGAVYPVADAGAAIRRAGSGHARGKVVVGG